MNDPVPLSDAQLGLLAVSRGFAAATASTPRTITVPITLQLTGPVDVPSLEAALRHVVARHEALRMRVVPTGDGLGQYFPPPAEDQVRLAVVDGGSDAASVVRRWQECDVRASGEAPLGAALVRVTPQRHVLIVAIDHLATDAWSNGVVTEELWTAYGALRSGRPVELAEVAYGFADHLAWLRSVGRELHGEQLAHWAGELGGARLTSLPRARRVPPRPAVNELIPVPLPDAIGSLGRRVRATSNAVLLTAVFVALWGLTGEQDLMTSFVYHGRDARRMSRTVGFLAREVPIRWRVRPEDSVAECCREVMKQCARAVERSQPPYPPQLVREIVATGRATLAPGHAHPVAADGMGLVCEFFATPPVALPPQSGPEGHGLLQAVPLPVLTAEHRPPVVDPDLLILGATEGKRPLLFGAFSPALAERATVESLLDAVVGVVRGFALDPSQPVAGLVRSRR